MVVVARNTSRVISSLLRLCVLSRGFGLRKTRRIPVVPLVLKFANKTSPFSKQFLDAGDSEHVLPVGRLLATGFGAALVYLLVPRSG